MEPLVDTVIEDARWQDFDLARIAEQAAAATLAALSMGQGYTLCVMGCDDARIATLNTEFRDKEVPTNVLSWPSEERGSDYSGEAPLTPQAGTPDDPTSLGDIALAYETCVREATDQGKQMVDHVTHLIVHGVLHLLGYDHIDDDDANLMEATEARILATLGLADPYDNEA